jgi:hypothetical protein
LADVFRQTIVRICQNENPWRLSSLSCLCHFKRKSELSEARTSHNQPPHFHQRGGFLLCSIADPKKLDVGTPD